MKLQLKLQWGDDQVRDEKLIEQHVNKKKCQLKKIYK